MHRDVAFAYLEIRVFFLVSDELHSIMRTLELDCCRFQVRIFYSIERKAAWHNICGWANYLTGHYPRALWLKYTSEHSLTSALEPCLVLTVVFWLSVT